MRRDRQQTVRLTGAFVLATTFSLSPGTTGTAPGAASPTSEVRAHLETASCSVMRELAVDYRASRAMNPPGDATETLTDTEHRKVARFLAFCISKVRQGAVARNSLPTFVETLQVAGLNPNTTLAQQRLAEQRALNTAAALVSLSLPTAEGKTWTELAATQGVLIQWAVRRTAWYLAGAATELERLKALESPSTIEATRLAYIEAWYGSPIEP